MPISHQYKTIFIHIPKTAGESMEKKLGMYGANGNPLERLWGDDGQNVLQHLTANQMRNNYITEEMFNSYFKFAFVRNPWDRAVSEYRWYLRCGEPMEFTDWVKTLDARWQVTDHLHRLEVGHNTPQYKFIYDDEHQSLINFVGRFENLDEDFRFVCESLRVKDVTLPHLNVNSDKRRTRHYRSYYSEETRKIITMIYRKDIELFDYDF